MHESCWSFSYPRSFEDHSRSPSCHCKGPVFIGLIIGRTFPVTERQPGDLGGLRGVADGVMEEARTRGFPSPPFGGFGFIVDYSSSIYAPHCNITT